MTRKKSLEWRRPGDKPLSESVMVSLPTHICVIRPQWVKATLVIILFHIQHHLCRMSYQCCAWIAIIPRSGLQTNGTKANLDKFRVTILLSTFDRNNVRRKQLDNWKNNQVCEIWTINNVHYLRWSNYEPPICVLGRVQNLPANNTMLRQITILKSELARKLYVTYGM